MATGKEVVAATRGEERIKSGMPPEDIEFSLHYCLGGDISRRANALLAFGLFERTAGIVLRRFSELG